MKSRPRDRLVGWLVDGFGYAHPLGQGRTRVGRQAHGDIILLHPSVSRDHAEFWKDEQPPERTFRDLGSRNGSMIDGADVRSRTHLRSRHVVRLGEVSMMFIGHPIGLKSRVVDEPLTGEIAISRPQKFVIRLEALELVVRTRSGMTGGGVLVYRSSSEDWRELSLAPLEFELLQVLCVHAFRDADFPAASRGCVSTRNLVNDLTFLTPYANEENVRQVARRLRSSLNTVGAKDLIASVKGRGYYLGRPVARE